MKNCSCVKKLPPGEISNNILNPLTTIKGYLQLNLMDANNALSEEILRLLLTEVDKIEDAVNILENFLMEKAKK